MAHFGEIVEICYPQKIDNIVYVHHINARVFNNAILNSAIMVAIFFNIIGLIKYFVGWVI